ncbi:MAG: hypothetical protein QQW96_23295 [Tychonema bourrellyi B0820]|nr:hypothetical protein [Tychonema bourrellyi B0820]
MIKRDIRIATAGNCSSRSVKDKRLGIGHRAWGMGHGAWGMGHGA